MKKKALVASAALFAAVDFTSAMKLESYNVSNGMSGMGRDIVLRLMNIAGNDSEKIRNLTFSKLHYQWKKHFYFLDGRKKLQKVPGMENRPFTQAEFNTGAAAAFRAVNAFLEARAQAVLGIVPPQPTNYGIAKIALENALLAMSQRKAPFVQAPAAMAIAALVLQAKEDDPNVVALETPDGRLTVSTSSIVLEALINSVWRNASNVERVIRKQGLAPFLVNKLIHELGNKSTRAGAADELDNVLQEKFTPWTLINYVNVSNLTNLLNASAYVWLNDLDDEYGKSYQVCNNALKLLNTMVRKNPKIATRNLLNALPNLFSDGGDGVSDGALKLLGRIVKKNPDFITDDFVKTLILQLGDYNGNYSDKSGYAALVLGSTAIANGNFAKRIFDALFSMIIRYEKPHFFTIMAVRDMVNANKDFATDGLFEALFLLLSHDDVYMRLRAVDALDEMVQANPKFATEALADKLIYMSLNDFDEDIDIVAIYALGSVLKAAPNFDTKNVISTLTHLADDDSNDDVRLVAMLALQDKGNIAKFIDELIQVSLNTSADENDRIRAVYTLGSVIRRADKIVDTKTLVDTLIDLSQSNSKMRKTAVFMLTHLAKDNLVDRKRVVDLLIRISNDLNANVRETAVYELTCLLENESESDADGVEAVDETSNIIDALVYLLKNNSNADVCKKAEEFLRKGNFYAPLFYDLESILGLRDYAATGRTIPVLDTQNPINLEEVDVPGIGDCGYHAIYYGIDPDHMGAHEYDRSQTGEHRALLLGRVRAALNEPQYAQQVRKLIAQEMTDRFARDEIGAFFATTTLNLNALRELGVHGNYDAIEAAIAEAPGVVEAYVDFLNNRPDVENWLQIAPLFGQARGNVADAIALVHNLHLVFVEGRENQAAFGRILHESPNPGRPVYVIQSSDIHYRAAKIKSSI
ncbi:hypothetical protein FACS1894122_08070 [Alphaproteobacteria bacterium]|nr:hypothetical protein FACS1894122_08070 [Alphaproteobacteria bacterium]